MGEVKWIKLATGLPDNRKIKQMRLLPNGDTIALMWVFLMCLAGETNDEGMIYFMPEIPYTDEMFATIFRRPLNTVRLALQTFEQFGMVEIVNNTVTIPNWGRHQSLDAYEKRKERDRLYQAERRAAQRALAEKSSDKSPDKSSDVAPLEEDIDKDIDKDKEVYVSIVSYLNEKAGTAYKSTTAKTKTAIKARLAEGFSVDDFKTVIDKKCAEWLGDPKMERYLRPETLFGTKFEGYLNAKVSKQQTKYGANGIAISNEKSDLEGVF